MALIILQRKEGEANNRYNWSTLIVVQLVSAHVVLQCVNDKDKGLHKIITNCSDSTVHMDRLRLLLGLLFGRG
jgi:hypothetical protein